MLRYLAGAAAIAVAVAAGAHPSVAAAKKYVFALVPKKPNNPPNDKCRTGHPSR